MVTALVHNTTQVVSHVTVTMVTMAQVVNTLAVPRTLVVMVAFVQRSTIPSRVPVNLAIMVTSVKTFASLVTSVTIAVRDASAQKTAAVTSPLVTATVRGDFGEGTVKTFAALDTLVTSVPRDVSAKMRHFAIL